MTDEQAIPQNVSFYPSDLAIIEAVQKRYGQSFSGAIRFIIREWQRTADPDGTLLQISMTASPSKTGPRVKSKS